ncbi:DUF2628 domain-containing protein [Limoniibacter endophyticus]|uniref:Uncharacterized protein n=1 Tax=Limoniibacter endophyticus TaxID=1565040 RepID=A0A8J3DIF8_9HYPH|nr:DUF2628 domain-containing protein [Limoniibacter endophyticus]GHC74494.1 hypothetical protein GCM10010136_23740 [Limoniibacter endophyticus]
MARYVVLERKGPTDAIFVKDGFKLLAFLLPVLWFLMHRMWWEALFALFAPLVVSVAANWLGLGPVSGLFLLLVQFAIGLEAQNLLVGKYLRKGFVQSVAIVAPSIEIAEIRYFHVASLSRDKPADAGHRRSPLVPSIGLFT